MRSAILALSRWWLTGLVSFSVMGCDGTAELELNNFESDEQFVSAPSDPHFSKQWYANNTGQLIAKDSNGDYTVKGIPKVDLQLSKAWDKGYGSSSVLVAIIDVNKVDVSHEDLQASLWKNNREKAGNGKDDDGNGFIDDVFGYDFVENVGNVTSTDPNEAAHATHLTGIIGATRGNGKGVVGIAPGIKIMHLRANANDYKQMSSAIRYARLAGVKIINLSQGKDSWFNAKVRDLFAAEKGILFVCSAGNSGTPYYNYPSSYPAANLLSVANADPTGMLWRSSNIGPTVVDIASFGLSIFSTLPGNSYGYETGTSQSAATVSGVAALLLSSEPTLTPTQMIERLKDTAMRVPYLTDLVGTAAIVDAEAALNTTINIGLTATSIPGQITLSWNAVIGATRYQVERDGTIVDNQLSRTFVHRSLVRNSAHIYRVRALVNGVYSQWSYRILQVASNQPITETLATPVQPTMDAAGNYQNNLSSDTKIISKENAISLRLHFTKVLLASTYDCLTVDTEILGEFEPLYAKSDAPFTGAFWSQWFPASSLKLVLDSDEAKNAIGYKVDRIQYVIK